MQRKKGVLLYYACREAAQWSACLTTVWVAMDAGAHKLPSMLVHTPTLPSALVTLQLTVVAVLITAGDVGS